jgi:asparaginyl-tRNA synthetase
MKTTYVKDLLRGRRREGVEVELLSWVKSRRDLGQIVFLDLCDSTGTIQAVAKSGEGSDASCDTGSSLAVAVRKTNASQAGAKVFSTAKTLSVESSVRAVGNLQCGPSGLELHLSSLDIIGNAPADFSPRPHSVIDVTDERLADHLLRNRHLYIRNEKVATILLFRHRMMGAIHEWFRRKGFIEITAPILTAAPLYEDRNAMSLEVNGENIFLTQCVGFYLESAVHAFEKVYNIGPSFRAEETRSKRHLMEYWHIKGELAWVNLEDLFLIVEDLISSVVGFCADECVDIEQVLGTRMCVDGLSVPFPRISYVDAVRRLNQLGIPFEFGTSMGSLEEAALSKQFASPFWITGIPRKVEPFPYVIDKDDPRVTMTADLIATNGYGELLGIAEKSADLAEIEERMAEKGKTGDTRYDWVRQLREFGCVPHGGFGIGVERLIRWLLDVPHVRDTIPFPRTFRRKVYP